MFFIFSVSQRPIIYEENVSQCFLPHEYDQNLFHEILTEVIKMSMVLALHFNFNFN